MRAPKPGAGGELAQHTQVYLDVHIALECLHMRYPEYIRLTSREERELYSYYLGLKGLKEEDATKRAQTQADLERDMARSMSHGDRA